MRCKTCNIKFEVVYFNQKYCSNECKHKSEKQPKQNKVKKYKCKQCKQLFVRTISSVQPVCSTKCAIEYSKLLDEKKRKSIQRNKRIIHSDVYIKENKEDLQKTINKIIRLIDKGVKCIDCKRTESKPHWDAGHRKSVGSTPSLRYHLDNIFNQTRYCNSFSEGNKSAFDKGIKKMYGEDYFNHVDSLQLKYPVLKLHHSEIPLILKEARKIERELKKLDLIYTPKQRIKLRKELNKRLGIYT